MSRLFLIARREFISTLKSRLFLLGLLFPVVVVVAGMLVGGIAMRQVGRQDGQRVLTQGEWVLAVHDPSGRLLDDLQRLAVADAAEGGTAELTIREVTPVDSAEQEAIREGVAQGRLDAFLVVDRQAAAGRVSRVYAYSDEQLWHAVRDLLMRAVAARRLRDAGLTVTDIEQVLESVPLALESPVEGTQAMSSGQREIQRAVGMGSAFFFMFLMFMGLFGISQHLLTGLIEEKSSRVIEVLLSAVSPFELMAGKVLGLGGAGLVGMALAAAMILGTAATQGLLEAVRPAAVLLFIAYYVLGFLLAGSMYAALGAACTKARDARSLMMPVTMVFIVPLMTWTHIVAHPHGKLALVFSYFPLTTPVVMVLRLVASPRISWWEVVASLLLLAACVPAAMWAAARIFRTGILMYGKPPRLHEMMRWIRSG